MIRSINENDINKIIELGSEYSDNFINSYNIENYINNSTYIINVYVQDNCIVGFIISDYLIDHIDIELVYVDEKFRNNGIGTKLVESLFEQENAEYIMLEVSKNNEIAQGLYKRLGFKAVALRPAYYNGVDAIVMRKDIK